MKQYSTRRTVEMTIYLIINARSDVELLQYRIHVAGGSSVLQADVVAQGTPLDWRLKLKVLTTKEMYHQHLYFDYFNTE